MKRKLAHSQSKGDFASSGAFESGQFVLRPGANALVSGLSSWKCPRGRLKEAELNAMFRSAFLYKSLDSLNLSAFANHHV